MKLYNDTIRKRKIMFDSANKGKQGRFQICALSVLCLSLFFIYGCGSAIKQYTRPKFNITTIKTIAVMPIENFTLDNYADEKIRSKISIELISRDINVIEPGEIVMAFKELKIKSVDSIRRRDVVSIGNMLKADAVLTGSVEAFGISKGITVSYPEVSVHLILFDAVTGDIIWSAWHTSGGASFWTRHFGAEGSTLDNVSEEVIKEAFDSLYNR